jgi:hypothetical protein
MEESLSKEEESEKVKIIQEAPSKHFEVTPAKKEQFQKCRLGLEAYQKARKELKEEEAKKKALEKINLHKQIRQKMENVNKETKNNKEEKVSESEEISSSKSSSIVPVENTEKGIIPQSNEIQKEINSMLQSSASSNQEIIELLYEVKQIQAMIEEMKKIPEKLIPNSSPPIPHPIEKKKKRRPVEYISESEEEEEEIQKKIIYPTQKAYIPTIHYVKRGRF